MSNRRKLPPTNPVSMLIRSQDGAQWPGGCDTCNAYQIVRAASHPNLKGASGSTVEGVA